MATRYYPLFKAPAHLSPVVWFNTIASVSAAVSVIQNPYNLSAWCFGGAVVAATAVIYHARQVRKDWWLTFTTALCTLLFGTAGPRVILYHCGVDGYEFWPPESFIFMGAVVGIVGWPTLSGIYAVWNGEFPAVFRAVVRKLFGWWTGGRDKGGPGSAPPSL